MADNTTVQSGLATLTAAGWDVIEPNEGGRFGSVGVLTAAQTAATAALVSGAGVLGVVSGAGKFGTLLSINPTDTLANWSDQAGTGVTFSLDTAVTFNGQPSIRLDIPASFNGGAGGVCRAGTAAATCRMPYSYDRSNFAIVVRSSSLTACSGASAFVGDASFTNFWSVGGSSGNEPQLQYAAGDWMTFKPIASDWAVGAGTPAVASLMRLRVNFTIAASNPACSVWIGFIGVIPKRPKATVVISPDDGMATHSTFLAPLLRHHRLPASFAITSSLIGSGANYMTAAQVLALEKDPTGLFECVNHNRIHSNVNSYGSAAAYMTDVMAGDAAMRSWGLSGKGLSHHVYPNSIWRDDLSALLSAAGFKSARASTASTNGEQQDQMIAAGDKLRWKLNIIANMQTGLTVANFQTAINTLKTYKGFGFINAHDFQVADGSFIYSFDNANQCFGLLAAERDAGNIEVLRYSDWYDIYVAQ